MKDRHSASLPKLIGPSEKLRATMKRSWEQPPVSYAEAKEQVRRIQSLSSPMPAARSKRIGF